MAQSKTKGFDTQSTRERTIIDFANYGLQGIFRLGKYSYKHAHRHLDTHRHEGMIEICYCDKGLQIYQVDGQQYRIRGGDIFVTFPGEPHSTDKRPEEKGVLYWLLIKISGDEHFLGYAPQDAKAFIKELLDLPSRHFKGDRSMKKTLDEIFNLNFAQQQPIHRLRIQHLLATFLLAVIQCATGNENKIPSARMTVVKNYIGEHICDNLSIEQLARLVNLSDSHFKSWFKQEMGMPPLDYIAREKITESKKLIRSDQSTTISDIAYKLSFSSSQYFATVFKKYAGLSPVAYRNKHTR